MNVLLIATVHVYVTLHCMICSLPALLQGHWLVLKSVKSGPFIKLWLMKIGVPL